jgi:long-chain acyl-CoA synthetase
VPIQFFLERFKNNRQKDALIWKGRTYSYQWILDAIESCREQLNLHQVSRGSIVSLEGDYSPNAIAFLLALVERTCIITPIAHGVEEKKQAFREIAQVNTVISFDAEDHVSIKHLLTETSDELLLRLKQNNNPALIIFSSGSSGKSKAIVHDFVAFLEKYVQQRTPKRMLAFLLFDHIGGLNTLFHTLSCCGCLITLEDRSPDKVCASIDQYHGQILPASPSFLNLMLLSKSYKKFDLSSLELINYGTESMGEQTLLNIRKEIPHVTLLQSYGMSEIGILRSKAKSVDSLWVKVGDEDYKIRVVDGLLEIKSKFTMLGYLNAESPFTVDGWLKTGDAVEQDGDYIRIVGRKSDMINIGGEKIYPIEIENVLQQMDEVDDVMVFGEKHLIMGSIVVAKFKLNQPISVEEFRKRMRIFCQDRLPAYGIPQKCLIVTDFLLGERSKKIRSNIEGN